MHSADVSLLLQRANNDDRDAAAELLPLIYDHLRTGAQQARSGERRDHTLQATALVHEAYAKLVGGSPIQWVNRAHSYDAAARAIRQILIDHARARSTEKRGGGASKLELNDFASAMQSNPGTIFGLDESLSRLEHEDPEAGADVRLRFFVGLTIDQTAEALAVSARKVDLVWSRACAGCTGRSLPRHDRRSLQRMDRRRVNDAFGLVTRGERSGRAERHEYANATA